MAVYEILLRGKEDGTLSGGHVIEFVSDGTDAQGTARWTPGYAKPLDAATLETFVGEHFAGVFSQTIALIAERDALIAELGKFKAVHDNAVLDAESATAEKDTAITARETYRAERDALKVELDSIKAKYNALKAEKIALKEHISTVRTELNVLKGTPTQKFTAEELISTLTQNDLKQIQAKIAASPEVEVIWARFLNKVNRKAIVVDGPVALELIPMLNSALGETRVKSLFAAIGIMLYTIQRETRINAV